MMNFKKYLGRLAFVLTAVALFGLASTKQTNAQIVLVESKYRIVEVDKFENRIGVALPDANPNKVQTWVYIKSDTRASKRTYHNNGFFRDEQLTPNGILSAAARNEGDLIKVNGGRDWDGSIDAKTIWM